MAHPDLARFEYIEFRAKLLDYSLSSNKGNINQNTCIVIYKDFCLCIHVILCVYILLACRIFCMCIQKKILELTCPKYTIEETFCCNSLICECQLRCVYFLQFKFQGHKVLLLILTQDRE